MKGKLCDFLKLWETLKTNRYFIYLLTGLYREKPSTWYHIKHFGHSFLPIRTSCPRRVYYISCRVFQTFHAVFGWKIINVCFQLLQNLYFMLRVVFVRVSIGDRHRSRPLFLLLTLSLPEVINMFFLSILFILYPSNRSWEYSNLSGRNCYLKLTPNSRNQFARKGIAARGEN